MQNKIDNIIKIFNIMLLISLLVMMVFFNACQSVEEKFIDPVNKLMSDKDMGKLDKLCLTILAKEVAVKPNNNYAESQRCFNLIYTDYIDIKCQISNIDNLCEKECVNSPEKQCINNCVKIKESQQLACYNRYRFRK